MSNRRIAPPRNTMPQLQEKGAFDMKLLMGSLIGFFALSLLTAAPVKADPLSWVDLRADEISFAFPGPGLIEITARYTVVNNMDHAETIVSDIGFIMSGALLEVKPIDVTRSLNECRVFNTPAECSGDCYVTTAPPIIGVCEWVYHYPPDTIPEICACFHSTEIKTTLPYSGQEIIAFVLDPGNALWEPSENDNLMFMYVVPISSDRSSWGEIKTLYEKSSN